MIERFVTVALQRRWLVVFVFVLVGVFGYLSWKELAVEAYPDIADTTAQVVTQYPGHAAEEVEEQITGHGSSLSPPGRAGSPGAAPGDPCGEK